MAIMDMICSKMVGLYFILNSILFWTIYLVVKDCKLLLMDVKIVIDSRATTALSRSYTQSNAITDDSVV